MTWLEVNLSEVADVQWGNTSITKASYVDNGFPAFSATGQDGYVEQAEHNVDGIVLSAIGARCGKCFLASGKWTAIKNTITIIPNPSKIHLRYLYVILNDETSWLTKGAAQPFITLGIARNRKIPLPPFAEQKRIAALLDTADNIMRLRKQAIAKLDALAQSVFVDMFGDPFSKKTETIKLGEVATIDMGQSPAGSTYNSNGEGVYLLNGPTEFGEKHPTPLQWTTTPTKMCKDGDVLFCVRGATAGKLNISNGSYCIGRGLAAIRSRNLDFANNEFIYILLKQYYSYFQNMGVGSTFINISKDDLINLPIPKVKKDSLLRFKKFEVENSNQKNLLERQRLNMGKMIASIQHQSFAVN